MVSLLSCLGLVWVGTVTFQADAISTKDFIREMARQSGSRLECDPLIGVEPIAVRFEDRALDEVLDVLATVVAAEWRESDGVRRLTRSPVFRRTQEALERRKVESLLQSMLEKAVEQVAKLPEFSAEDAKKFLDTKWLDNIDAAAFNTTMVALNKSTPAYRATVEFMAAIGSKRLAQMPIGSREVWSDRPTPMQQLLPKEAAGALKRLTTRVQLAIDTARSTKAGQSGLGAFMIGSGDPDRMGKTLFAVFRRGFMQFSAELVVVDEAGTVLITGRPRFPESAGSPSPGLRHEGTKLEVSEASKALAAIMTDIGYAWAAGREVTLADGTKTAISMGMSAREQAGLPLDGGMGAVLGDPLLHDPLGYAFGPVSMQAGEGRPTIVSLSDDALVSFMNALRLGMITTVGDVRSFLLQDTMPADQRVPLAESPIREGWYLVRPLLPLGSQSARFDRAAARDFIRSIRAAGGPSIGAARKYVMAKGVLPSLRSLDYALLSHAAHAADRGAVERLLRSPLDLLVHLPPNASGELPVAQLPADAKKVIERWVFWDYRATEGRNETVLDAEPTEAFPRGLPAGASVHVQWRSDLGLFATAKSGYHFAMQPEELAWHEISPNPTGFEGKRVLESFRPATIREVRATLRLTEEKTQTRSVREVLPVADTKPGPLGTLPKEWLERLEQAKKTMGGRD